jgi:hypothetical protein
LLRFFNADSWQSFLTPTSAHNSTGYEKRQVAAQRWQHHLSRFTFRFTFKFTFTFKIRIISNDDQLSSCWPARLNFRQSKHVWQTTQVELRRIESLISASCRMGINNYLGHVVDHDIVLMTARETYNSQFYSLRKVKFICWMNQIDEFVLISRICEFKWLIIPFVFVLISTSMICVLTGCLILSRNHDAWEEPWHAC